jgi:Fur family iron response transcriptional regulator
MHAAPEAGLSPTEAAELLRGNGINPTQQRTDIAVFLLGAPRHVCADTLLEWTNQRGGGISKATIYNTLRLFAAHGLLREVIVEPTKTFYDSNTGPHHHFYDAELGELTDIAPQEINLGRLPAPPAGSHINHVDVVVRVSRKR